MTGFRADQRKGGKAGQSQKSLLFIGRVLRHIRLYEERESDVDGDIKYH